MEINYSLLPEHMQEGMKLYIENGIPPGDFLLAVLENNLMEAFGRADSINRYALFDFCQFLYNKAPPQCYGSPDKVAEWLNKKGD